MGGSFRAQPGGRALRGACAGAVAARSLSADERGSFHPTRRPAAQRFTCTSGLTSARGWGAPRGHMCSAARRSCVAWVQRCLGAQSAHRRPRPRRPRLAQRARLARRRPLPQLGLQARPAAERWVGTARCTLLRSRVPGSGASFRQWRQQLAAADMRCRACGQAVLPRVTSSFSTGHAWTVAHVACCDPFVSRRHCQSRESRRACCPCRRRTAAHAPVGCGSGGVGAAEVADTVDLGRSPK